MIRKLIMFELKNTPIMKYVWTMVAIGLTVYLGRMLLDVIVPSEARLPVLADILFFIAISVPVSTIRYKPFTIQNLKGTLYASSFFILLKQTPISNKAIRKSRFIIVALYTVVLNSILFLSFYLASEPFREILTPLDALVLGICWLAFSYIWGGMLAASEVGGSFTHITLAIWSIVYLFFFIGVLTACNLLLGAPILIWSIEMAQTNPFLLLVVSLGIVLISTIIWNFEYKRYEKKVDYHL